VIHEIYITFKSVRTQPEFVELLTGVDIFECVLCEGIDVTIAAAPGVSAYQRVRGSVRRLAPPRSLRSLDEAVIFHGGARWWLPTRFASGISRVMRACYLERAYGDCYGYLWALRGCADAVIDYGVKPWDVVPLAALARATGRVMTDFSGRSSWTGPQTVFASPSVARLIIKMLHAA
jgi:fructose-1,6-bisphosphatase/inositol monophosphatase family enzyme